MTPTALRIAASTDCVLAALLRLHVSLSKISRNEAKYGDRSREEKIKSIQRKEDRDADFLDDNGRGQGYGQGQGQGQGYGQGQGQGQGYRGPIGTSYANEGYTGLVPQFTVSLLNLVMESTAVIFEAQVPHGVGGGGDCGITPMTR